MARTENISFRGGDAMKKALKEIAAKMGTAGKVQVGFFENERYTPVHPIRKTPRKPLPVAQVAFWQINGTRAGWFRIPKRDFFGAAIRANQGYWPKDIVDLARAHNYNAARVLGLMGKAIQEDVQTQIRRWSQPPNSKKWEEIKGFNKPLIDDGTMVNAVTFRVLK